MCTHDRASGIFPMDLTEEEKLFFEDVEKRLAKDKITSLRGGRKNAIFTKFSNNEKAHREP